MDSGRSAIENINVGGKRKKEQKKVGYHLNNDSAKCPRRGGE